MMALRKARIVTIATVAIVCCVPATHGQSDEGAADGAVRKGSGLEGSMNVETGVVVPDFLVGTWSLETEGALISTTVFDGMESRGLVTTFVRDFRDPDLISERYIRESNLFASLEFVDESILRVTREDGEPFVCVYHLFSSAVDFTYQRRIHVSCKTSQNVDYLLSFLPRPGTDALTVTYELTGEPAGEHYSRVDWQAVAQREAQPVNGD